MDGDRDVSVYWLARRGAGSEGGGLFKPQGAAGMDAAGSAATWGRPKTTAEQPLARKLTTAS